MQLQILRWVDVSTEQVEVSAVSVMHRDFL